MNSKPVQSEQEQEGVYVCLPVPVGDPDVFSHNATAEILHVLVDNPQEIFTNRQLHRLTGKGMGNVNSAVLALEALGVIRVERSGRANQIQIDTARLIRPDDRVTAIPQAEYHAPVREILDRIETHIGEDAGVVLFGSVAHGDADRASDIDLFVIVRSDRMQAQREAHNVEDEMASERFGGDRYEPHIIVETQESAAKHDQIRDVLTKGLTLRETPPLEAVKQEVFSNGT